VPLPYALVTPVRTEARNLGRLATSLDAQTHPPSRWVIVDNGSEDDTLAAANALAATREWITVISVRGEERAVPGAPVVRSFHAGLHELLEVPDIVVKLDADTSMDEDHFERLTAAFEEDRRLGIAGGVCLEADEEGTWRGIPVALGHVRGAVRAYRRECLFDVLPLEERVGWDGIDGWKAAVRGWTTRTLPELAFYHHRPLGARDGEPTARWRTQGRAAWFMGYRFSYLFLRTVHRARKDRAALGMLGGFLHAALRREARYSDAEVRAYVRRNQSIRAVVSRFIETRRLPLVH
jgi:poly-beta-1,6-N-acetyl-D-glucosamine synthase